MGCRNKNCEHYCSLRTSRNGCNLFPGISVLKCRGFRP